MRSLKTDAERFPVEEVVSEEQMAVANILVPVTVKKFLRRGTTVTFGILAENLKYCNRDAIKLILNRLADEEKIGLIMQGDVYSVISGPNSEN